MNKLTTKWNKKSGENFKIHLMDLELLDRSEIKDRQYGIDY